MIPVAEKQCATCPFRDTGWTEVRALLQTRALNEASPICHSTGKSALVSKRKLTSSTEKICRGARDFQINIFYKLGVISEPTDAAWKAKADSLGLK